MDLNSLIAQYGVQPDFGQRKGGKIKGPGTGKSDSIPALLMDAEGEPAGTAALSDGEFVIASPAVATMGGGSTDAGFEFFDTFMAMIDRMSPEQAALFAEMILAMGKEVLAEAPASPPTETN